MGNKDIFANSNSVPDNEKFGEVKPHKIRVFGLQEYKFTTKREHVQKVQDFRR